jgi:DNA-directed RNA polymerase specialized sigma24 family protein
VEIYWVNAMLDDLELLRAYAVNGSDDAFRSILERHVNLVYSAALRQVCDPHLAEQVTQAVFVILARKAGSVRSGTVLVGWLFRTARFVAAGALREQQRRQRSEQEAARWNLINPRRSQRHRGKNSRHPSIKPWLILRKRIAMLCCSVFSRRRN